MSVVVYCRARPVWAIRQPDGSYVCQACGESLWLVDEERTAP